MAFNSGITLNSVLSSSYRRCNRYLLSCRAYLSQEVDDSKPRSGIQSLTSSDQFDQCVEFFSVVRSTSQLIEFKYFFERPYRPIPFVMESSSFPILDTSWPTVTDPLDQKGASSSPPFRSKMLLFGKTGQGKSSIANMLVSGELLPVPLFPTGDGMCGTTKVVATHNGRGFHVTDTVGLGEDPAGSDGPPASELIFKFLKETKGEYSHILFVTPAGRFDHLDADIAELFPTIFEGAEPAFGVVVTKCRNPRRWQQEHEKELEERFGAFIKPGRYVYVDFPATDEEPKEEHKLKRRRMQSLERLEAFLQRVVEENGPACFKPKYATATDAGLKVYAMKLWSIICDFFKYQILQRRRL